MTPEEDMISVVHEVLVDEKITAYVTSHMNIPRATLQRYVKKMNASRIGTFTAKFNHCQIFCKGVEIELVEYLMTPAKMYNGLSPKDARHIAFQLFMRNVDKDRHSGFMAEE